ncbi:CLN1 [Cyberlindnera jadinii]|uniref:CLN1 protein n=1 Tax=Cyberlindnera jadinii (strain ATCC 18201 / CBS 1600 / BCRC 20928 / JCM 3617 / NBRC 0987 / NRRL Y-1542) TaxID=983966 RepID=A0A0H5C2W2_CYBJN|nr:cyclin-like protein [Cyberlindnera jadinii NRRL Y-1542]ODV72830.1 cyclin-like protein [Cyberlindnera jadinii NRRL Y-1542]CEP22151.1 CLN1 [Cyberlindnera jadinii]
MPGLVVTATQIQYPFQLSTSELLTHRQTILEYRDELSQSLHAMAKISKPDLSLISQQPELKPSLRAPILEFLLHISIKTKVTYGIYYQAVRLFDRYCSKRIVLREQLQLVLATCLWIAAKTAGGCNHIINNTTVPTGGRFHGPNPRARIPRLSELCILCQDDQKYDEGMFVQMERHILDTLNWDICEPHMTNWLLDFYENNLVQFEMENMVDKVEIINCKRFIMECCLLELKLMELHPAQLAQVLLSILQANLPQHATSSTFQSELNFVEPLDPNQLKYYTQMAYDTVLKLPNNMLQFYSKLQGVTQLYHTILKHSIQVDSTLQTPVRPQFLPTPPASRRGSPVGTMNNIV